jgi:DNA-binding response OmpR family regulator
VAAAVVFFPTDLENNTTARPAIFKIIPDIIEVPLGLSWLNSPRSEFFAMQLRNRRILYIEDHEDTRELVTIILSQNHYDVVTGSTIRAGIRLARSDRFDLYLLDSWLPDGSGLDLCRQIREFDPLTPILFYSAAAYEADREDALKSGAQGYLIKPSQTSELCSIVSTLIEASYRELAVRHA